MWERKNVMNQMSLKTPFIITIIIIIVIIQ